MALHRILPEVVSRDWDFYAPLIAKGLPPISGDSYRNMVNVLEAVLLEKLICWGYYSEDGELDFLVTTSIHYDEVSKTRKLLIYTVTGMTTVTSAMFVDSLNILKKFAKAEQCEYIITYTRSERVVNYMSNGHIGADASYRLIEMEVDK